jgi:hypothetical protein
MPGAVGSDPYALTPDQRHRVGGDLPSATNGRQRALGDGSTPIDKWCGERPFAHGYTTLHEHWRQVWWASGVWHMTLHAPRPGLLPVDELDRSVLGLERRGQYSQEYPQAEQAYESSNHPRFDTHRDSFKLVQHP